MVRAGKIIFAAITHLLIFQECTLPECIKNAPTSWHWKTQTHRTACGSARRNLPTPCAAGRISSCLVEKAIGQGKTGRTGVTAALSEKAQILFPGSHVVGAWSAQDCITPDHIPYIGSYSPYRPDWLVATGFQKWGMSTAMIAAEILCDQLCSKENPYADLFRPRPLLGTKHFRYCQ